MTVVLGRELLALLNKRITIFRQPLDPGQERFDPATIMALGRWGCAVLNVSELRT
jgi:hypothetical protein